MEHTPEEIAKAIAEGHGYNHVSYSREHWQRDLGVSTREEYGDHILSTLRDPETKAFVTVDGGAQFYNERTNTHVGYDPNSPDLGSCFRPSTGDEYLKEQYNKDCISRGDWSRERMSEKGGIDGLEEVERTREGTTAQPERAELPKAFETQDIGSQSHETANESPFTFALDVAEESLSTARDALGPNAATLSDQEVMADYFARAVDDSQNFPPLDQDMADEIEYTRQSEYLEDIGKSQESRDGADKQARLQERAEHYMSLQQQQQM